MTAFIGVSVLDSGIDSFAGRSGIGTVLRFGGEGDFCFFIVAVFLNEPVIFLRAGGGPESFFYSICSQKGLMIFWSLSFFK